MDYLSKVEDSVVELFDIKKVIYTQAEERGRVHRYHYKCGSCGTLYEKRKLKLQA